ncbi:DNA-formamidopyrimidine glycosylase family protein [bacterium RCC_150]
MPELPEITALAEFLDRRLSGAQLTRLTAPPAFALKRSDVPFESLAGGSVESVDRQGKFLVFKICPAEHVSGETDPLHLIVNFAKSGWLSFSVESSKVEDAASDGYFAAKLEFTNGGQDYSVTLADTGDWKGLAIFIVRDPSEVHGIAELGPDALDSGFGIEEFRRLFTKKQQIKGLLKNQQLIGGIGNAYSDEILHAAKLSPVALASTLEPEEVERLFRTMKDVLTGAVRELSGKEPAELKPAKKSSMRVHGRTGEACPVCGDTVREIAFVGTSLQYCPTCQTQGEVLVKRGSTRKASAISESPPS